MSGDEGEVEEEEDGIEVEEVVREAEVSGDGDNMSEDVEVNTEEVVVVVGGDFSKNIPFLMTFINI